VNLSGKRVAVLVEQMYQEMEVWYPVYRLREAGCTVELVAPEAGKTYASKLGYPAKATLAASDARADQFAAVVIPGGFSPDYIRRSEPMLKLVRDLHAQGKPVAAICHGPQMLISADVLRGRTLTCTPSIAVDVKNAGGLYVDRPVVEDGNIITSRKPDDIPQFADAIVRALGRTGTLGVSTNDGWTR
jgi:protease I